MHIKVTKIHLVVAVVVVVVVVVYSMEKRKKYIMFETDTIELCFT